MQWYLTVLKRYAQFSGRARRSEYWWYTLFNFLIMVALVIVEMVLGSEQAIVATLYQLAVLIPSIAVSIRRLHDTGRSGWWLLIGVIPFLGALVLLFFMIQDSEAGDNRFGPSPKNDQPL